ncbi:MAG: hypothetical protein BWY75_02682 [bacterium ADurb.Bin425]|nr:MAG: hypothetical protein BWY75_02682 [bacterium ADurb.Bin425]
MKLLSFTSRQLLVFSRIIGGDAAVLIELVLGHMTGAVPNLINPGTAKTIGALIYFRASIVVCFPGSLRTPQGSGSFHLLAATQLIKNVAL